MPRIRSHNKNVSPQRSEAASIVPRRPGFKASRTLNLVFDPFCVFKLYKAEVESFRFLILSVKQTNNSLSMSFFTLLQYHLTPAKYEINIKYGSLCGTDINKDAKNSSH